MDMGNFSVGLAVKDIHVSKAFYEGIGFKVFAGDVAQLWLVMKSDYGIVCLFQGIIPENALIFNPGWNRNAEPVDPFTDVRELQAMVKAQGIPLTKEVAPDTVGPGHFIFKDPDGNVIYVDQHR